MHVQIGVHIVPLPIGPFVICIRLDYRFLLFGASLT